MIFAALIFLDYMILKDFDCIADTPYRDHKGIG